MFRGCESLKRVVLPSAIKKLDDAGLSRCLLIRKIETPSLNEMINKKCENLPEDELIISSCVTSIGSLCFYNCDLLKTIQLPSSLIYIGSNSFANCTSLTSITIPSSVKRISEKTFSECKSLVSIEYSTNSRKY